jgi:hypothetical protein
VAAEKYPLEIVGTGLIKSSLSNLFVVNNYIFIRDKKVVRFFCFTKLRFFDVT